MFIGLMLANSSSLKASHVNESLEKDFASRVSLHDDILIEKEFVDYFKEIAAEKLPIIVSVRVRDVYGKSEEYEDEKDFSPDQLKKDVTRSFLLGKFDGLRSFLSLAFQKYPSDSYEIRATIQVKAPNHREKVNGFCVIAPDFS